MNKQEKINKLKTCIHLAGEQAQQIRRAGLNIDVKGKSDFVTQADNTVEAFLQAQLQLLFPEDGFLGEEGGLITGTQGTWVIDPIDGTSNYLQGMDYWCISLAYVVQGTIQLGFIYAPDRDEFFFAEQGQGAWLNDQPLIMANSISGQEIIGIGHSNRVPLTSYFEVISILDNHGVDHRRFGAGALMLAHVASGQVHGYFEAHLNSWDALAGVLLVQEAGGKVSHFLDHNGLFEGNAIWASTPNLWPLLEPLSTQCFLND